jgi:adenosylcobinamide-phosphate synthase
MEKMFTLEASLILDSVLTFCLAFFIDLTFGELPDRFHPTLWMGKIIERLKTALKHENPRIEIIHGVFLCLIVLTLFVVPVSFILLLIRETLGRLPYIVVSAIMFQTTFAIKCMKQYTLPVAEAVKKKDYNKAKELLPFIVRRNPNNLTDQHIVSAAVETIAEGTTDGITSPFFYFALFGVPGAVAFRVINTLDSMVGYKDQEHINIGWFSAKMDTIANYIPARLTAILMILSAILLRENWRKSWIILKRDRKNTASPNAGWTIATMAGALNIKLEKPSFYEIGDTANLEPKHIKKALQMMILTSILFVIMLIFPILILKAGVVG